MSNIPLDIVDENNIPTGEQKIKTEILEAGLWYRSVHVWIYNSKGEILLQLRGKDKKLCPNIWDTSVAGGVDSGEEPIESALRETKEEIGLELDKEKLEFTDIYKFQTTPNNMKNNEFTYNYLYNFEGSIDDLKIQPEELDDIKFFSIPELKQKLKTNPEKYLDHSNYWNEIFDEVEKRIK